MTRKKKDLIPVEERLWSKVIISGPDDCWVWTGYKSPKGYGQMKDENNKVDRVHRIALRLSGVCVGFGTVVLHECDNPPCCNPAHLRIGTIADNTADMVLKKRNKGPSGESNSKSKLTHAQVTEIRNKYSDRKISTQEIAKIYGVSQPTISYILINKTWNSVDK